MHCIFEDSKCPFSAKISCVCSLLISFVGEKLFSSRNLDEMILEIYGWSLRPPQNPTTVLYLQATCKTLDIKSQVFITRSSSSSSYKRIVHFHSAKVRIWKNCALYFKYSILSATIIPDEIQFIQEETHQRKLLDKLKIPCEELSHKLEKKVWTQWIIFVLTFFL